MRGLRRALVLAALCCAGCETVSDPFDYAINLGTFPHDPTLRAPVDGVRRLVVLRHGLFRSAAALWKLERALEDHGYEVFNRSYGSTKDFIEDHAARLHRELEAHLAATESDPRPLELVFVGHSMGGLQVRSYLSREDARPAKACVFLGTPHRGAALLDARKDWFIFELVMGDEGVYQLGPGHVFYATLGAVPCPFGDIYGGYGNGSGRSSTVPGDDDGTVAVDEAQLEGAVDSIRLPLGHTWLGIDDRSIHQVLWFLRHGGFDHRAGV